MRWLHVSNHSFRRFKLMCHTGTVRQMPMPITSNLCVEQFRFNFSTLGRVWCRIRVRVCSVFRCYSHSKWWQIRFFFSFHSCVLVAWRRTIQLLLTIVFIIAVCHCGCYFYPHNFSFLAFIRPIRFVFDRTLSLDYVWLCLLLFIWFACVCVCVSGCEQNNDIIAASMIVVGSDSSRYTTRRSPTGTCSLCLLTDRAFRSDKEKENCFEFGWRLTARIGKLAITLCNVMRD